MATTEVYTLDISYKISPIVGQKTEEDATYKITDKYPACDLRSITNCGSVRTFVFEITDTSSVSEIIREVKETPKLFIASVLCNSPGGALNVIYRDRNSIEPENVDTYHSEISKLNATHRQINELCLCPSAVQDVAVATVEIPIQKQTKKSKPKKTKM